MRAEWKPRRKARSVSTIAILMGVNKATVERMLDDGRLEGYRNGHLRYVYLDSISALGSGTSCACVRGAADRGKQHKPYTPSVRAQGTAVTEHEPREPEETAGVPRADADTNKRQTEKPADPDSPALGISGGKSGQSHKVQ